MSHVIHNALACSHEAADRRERLGERPHDDIHIVRKAEVVRGAAAAVAQYAEAMRVVHHDPCAVRLCKPHDLRQVRNVAAHGEHAVRHDEDARGIRYPLQTFFEVLHVVVPIAQHGRIGEFAAVIDARVVFAVADHIIVLSADGGDDAEIGLKAR